MALQLIADVGSAQHCAVIDEVLVAPLAGAARFLPGTPYVQEGDEIPFPNSKPACQ